MGVAAQLRWHLSDINMINIILQVLLQDRKFDNREINERSFSNPNPRTVVNW